MTLENDPVRRLVLDEFMTEKQLRAALTVSSDCAFDAMARVDATRQLVKEDKRPE
jgi:hypothetical protein